MAYPYLIQGSNIVIVIGSKSHTINKTHITYEKVKEAIKAQDWNAIPDLIEPKKVVIKFGAGNVAIDGETFLWKGKPMHNALSSKMIDMLKEGFSIEPMVAFMTNLMTNPSKRAVEELYGFLEKGNLPITPDGHFLAYKKVRQDYKDVHSGTFDNSIGQVCEMERNAVDDDKDRTCSAGLHFCSESYLAHFGGERVVILKINPRDVVSIPSDYNDAKGRTCRYEVIGEVGDTVKPKDEFTSAVQTNGVTNANKWPFPTRTAAPVAVTTGPKLGTTPFYQGYTAGFLSIFNVSRDLTNQADYVEGYSKGRADRNTNGIERYRYDAPKAVAPQDYDKSGRPLSMTKDAIRKRQARLAQRAAGVQAAIKASGYQSPYHMTNTASRIDFPATPSWGTTPIATPGGWPQPKKG